MDEFHSISIFIYVIAVPIWVIFWKQLVGFSWLKKIPMLNITFFGGILILIINAYLTYLSEVPEYTTELGIYDYVERNAITVAGLALVIATFSIVAFSRGTSIDQDRRMNLYIKCVFAAFLFGVLGVLPLYWVPQKYGWLTILRHLKTVPELFSVLTLGSAMITFLSSIKIQELKDIKIEITKRKRAEKFKKNKIEWDPNLSVGVRKIDNQHKMLVHRIKELSEAIDREENSSFLFDTMNFLIEYTDNHFRDEEKLMEKYDYPEFESHKMKHDEFKQILKNMAQELIDKGATQKLAERVNVFLINWVIDHVKGVDQELGVFLSNKMK
jgi:hemerythrin-like metal-binding protein